MTSVFVAIKFPFKIKQYEAQGYTKRAYVIATIAAPVIDGVVVSIQGALGYATFFLPIGCSPSDPDVTYYTFTLPLTIINCTAGALLIIIFWELTKAAYLHYNRMSGTKVLPVAFLCPPALQSTSAMAASRAAVLSSTLGWGLDTKYRHKP